MDAQQNDLLSSPHVQIEAEHKDKQRAFQKADQPWQETLKQKFAVAFSPESHFSRFEYSYLLPQSIGDTETFWGTY